MDRPTSVAWFSGHVLGEPIQLSVSDASIELRIDQEDCTVRLCIATGETGRVHVSRLRSGATLFIEDREGILLAAVAMSFREARRAERVINQAVGKPRVHLFKPFNRR